VPDFPPAVPDRFSAPQRTGEPQTFEQASDTFFERHTRCGTRAGCALLRLRNSQKFLCNIGVNPRLSPRQGIELPMGRDRNESLSLMRKGAWPLAFKAVRFPRASCCARPREQGGQEHIQPSPTRTTCRALEDPRWREPAFRHGLCAAVKNGPAAWSLAKTK
jgi:hypothetical protein